MNQRSREHVSGTEIDLFDLIDLNGLRMKILIGLMDELTREERDFIAARYGILDYEDQGRQTFQDLAQRHRKTPSTLCRWHARIINKLRDRMQLN